MSLILGILDSGGVTVAPNSYESIATVTVGSGGAANVEFTSIPGTYTHLQIRYIARGVGTADYGKLQLNSDTGNNYARHLLDGNGSSTSAEGVASTGTMYVAIYAGTSAAASIFGAGVVDILDYANTNKYTTVRVLGGNDRNGAGTVELRSGLWMNTNAVTSIKVTGETGNIQQYSQFALYGIKGA
jgi:hypothetical protein